MTTALLLRLVRPACFGALAALLSLLVSTGFRALTGLDPGLLGLPAGYVIGRAISLGSFGQRSPALAALTTVFVVAYFLLSLLPLDLWNASGQNWFWTTLSSIGNRVEILFSDQEANSFGHFLELLGILLSTVVGGSWARAMNE